LSAVSGGGLSWDLGIVVISLIALAIAFVGYKVVHNYERWCWIPALIAITITVGCGGHLLKQQAPTEPVAAASVLTFACVVTSFTLTWSCMVSDFADYTHPSVSKYINRRISKQLPTAPIRLPGSLLIKLVSF